MNSEEIEAGVSVAAAVLRAVMKELPSIPTEAAAILAAAIINAQAVNFAAEMHANVTGPR